MPIMSGRRLAGAVLALSAQALVLSGTGAAAQEKPGDADLCYRSVSAEAVTIPEIIAACSRVIATQGKAKGDLAMAYNNRGAVFLATRQLGNAVEDFGAVIALEPDSAMARANRGEAYRLQRNYDLALADEDAAIRLQPDLQLAYLNR